MTPLMVYWVGDPVNKRALLSSGQIGLMTHGSQNGCSPTNLNLKRGNANTGKEVETLHLDGGTQIPKAARVSTFSLDLQSCLGFCEQPIHIA